MPTAQAGPTTSAKLDPRFLQRPGIFSEERADRRIWKLRFSAWLTGVDARFREGLKEAEQFPSPMEITMVPVDMQDLATFLFAELVCVSSGILLEKICEPETKTGLMLGDALWTC